MIAQDVQAAFPDLVSEHADGYLMVDYGGLSVELGRARGELAARVQALEADVATRLSDRDSKREVAAVEQALARLRDGEGAELLGEELTALVGLLVEAVKELDARLGALEHRAA